MVAGADGITILKQYRSFGMKPRLVGNGWDEIYSFSHPDLVEDCLSDQAYFMTLDNPKNKQFVAKYHQQFGAGKPINAIGEAAYDAVWLYSLAVAKAGSTQADKVIPMMSQVEFDAPQGHVNFSALNNHMRCNSILGRARKDGSWEIVENFGQIDPQIPGCKLG